MAPRLSLMQWLMSSAAERRLLSDIASQAGEPCKDNLSSFASVEVGISPKELMSAVSNTR